MTKDELAGKVDWEGGVTAAMEYGISATDLPEDTPASVRSAWQRLEASIDNDLDIINRWLWTETNGR